MAGKTACARAFVGIAIVCTALTGNGARHASAASNGAPYPGQQGSAVQYVSATGVAMPADQMQIVAGSARILAIVPWSAGPSTPEVWKLHAFTGTYDMQTSVAMHQLVDAWVNRGWVVLSIDAGAGVTRQVRAREQEWGNEAVRLAAVDAFAWAHPLWPGAPGPLLYGVSMGGLAAVNIAYEFGARGLPLTAVALNSPALDLRADWTIARTRSTIRLAYGLPNTVVPGDPRWVAAVDAADGGHDVAVRGVAGIPWGIPFRQYVGTKDHAIPPSVNAGAFDAMLSSAGWPAEHAVLSFPTGHIGAATYQPDDVDAFFDRALAAASPP